LASADREALAAMLDQGDDGKWTNVEYTCRDAVAVTRALAGFLLLGEDVLWTAGRQVNARDAFHRMAEVLRAIGQSADGNLIDVGGASIKVRYANGDEGFHRLDTGRRMRFIARTVRRWSVDLVILDEAVRSQREDLLPALAARPNPQLVTLHGLA